ncbi:unnamed protein product [Victoria cruziana]
MPTTCAAYAFRFDECTCAAYVDSVRLEGTPDHPELADVGIGLETVSKPVFAGPCLDGTDLLKGNAPQAEESTVYEVSSEDARKLLPKKNAEKHRQAERKRRLKFNEKIQALKSLIPYAVKVDMASILDEAAKYMKSLKQQAEGPRSLLY